MIKNLACVPLNKIVIPVDRSEAPLPGKMYRQLGVRLWGQGAYERESIDGIQTNYKTLSRVEANDIVVNKIWARNGTVTVIPENLSGCYVSNEFPTFTVIPDALEPKWFYWFTKTMSCWQQCDEKSRGTSGKNRIRPEKFLEIAVPLPPLKEQQRIVARIEELAEKIEEARGLRKRAIEDWDVLCRSIIFSTTVDKKLTPMHELVSLRELNVTVSPLESYSFAGVYSFGRGVFKQHSLQGTEFSYNKLTRLSAGNFVYPKLMAWEGALGTVPDECDGLVVSPEFPVFDVNEDKVLPETLDVYFRTPSVWSLLSGISTGTNIRRRRLHPSNFLQFEIPLPDMKTQQKLRDVKAKSDQMKSHRQKALQEFDALLPAILDKAFKGEL
jgi:type I restriction enzyme S subunit